jgi:Do/DeqQ family serine protease
MPIRRCPRFRRAIPAALLLALVASWGPSLARAEEVPSVPQSRAEIALSFAAVVKTAAPAVVNVTAARAARASPFDDDPVLRRFFAPRRAPGASNSLGSGVLVDPSGVIVTNAHVIADAAEIRVSLADRREFPARLVLKDDRTDLAVLKIEGREPFPTLPIGATDALEVGDLVLAIGNPFGVGQTVTQGIVSALARTQVGVSDYRFFIQTDAAINPGNSGGALVDMAGRLVGINTAIYSRSGGSNGIGFAVPADMVRIVVQSAAAGGTVRRPWFGARLQPMTRELAEQLGLDRPSGALVTEVLPDGPARRAGLTVGDVVTAVAGEPVYDPDTFGYLFAMRGVGGRTAVEIRRDGERVDLDVPLESPPERPARDARELSGRTPFSGATVMNLSPALADEIGVELSQTGVVVAGVAPRSLAERVGLRARDRILAVNGERIGDTRTLEAVAGNGARYWDISIERDGRQLNLVLGG